MTTNICKGLTTCLVSVLFASHAQGSMLSTCQVIVNDGAANEADKIWCEGFIFGYDAAGTSGTTSGHTIGHAPELVLSQIRGSVTDGYEVPYQVVALNLSNNWLAKLEAGESDWATVFDPGQSQAVTSVPDPEAAHGEITSNLVTSAMTVNEWAPDLNVDKSAVIEWASKLPPAHAGYTVVFPSNSALREKLLGDAPG